MSVIIACETADHAGDTRRDASVNERRTNDDILISTEIYAAGQHHFTSLLF